jgi:hypothetical protein
LGGQCAGAFEVQIAGHGHAAWRKVGQAFLADQINRTLSVLTLADTFAEARLALSSNYLKVALPFSDLPANVLLEVCVGRVENETLYAYPELQNRAPESPSVPGSTSSSS